MAASLCNYDAIVFTETFLNSEIYSSDIFSDNIVYRCDRSKANRNKLCGCRVLVAVSITLRSAIVSFEIDLITEEIWI